jgi:hypothetical protein
MPLFSFFSTACGTADNRGDMSSSNIFFTVLCSTSKLKHYQFCNLIRWWWARSENDRKHKRFFLGNSYRGEPIKLYITISLLYCCSFGRASASTTFGDGRKESLKLVNVSSSVFGNWCVQEPGHPRQAIASGSGRIILYVTLSIAPRTRDHAVTREMSTKKKNLLNDGESRPVHTTVVWASTASTATYSHGTV